MDKVLQKLFWAPIPFKRYQNTSAGGTDTGPIATKHDKVVTYCEGLLPIKSHKPLYRWPCEIT